MSSRNSSATEMVGASSSSSTAIPIRPGHGGVSGRRSMLPARSVRCAL
jgi:hypothetical protein